MKKLTIGLFVLAALIGGVSLWGAYDRVQEAKREAFTCGMLDGMWAGGRPALIAALQAADAGNPGVKLRCDALSRSLRGQG